MLVRVNVSLSAKCTTCIHKWNNNSRINTTVTHVKRLDNLERSVLHTKQVVNGVDVEGGGMRSEDGLL